MAPFGVRESTSKRFQFWLTLRLMISTYHPKRLPKSPLLMLTGPLDAAFCAMVARGRTEPDCSRNWARFSCLGGGGYLWGLGAVCFWGFVCLPEMGMAVSSTSCFALGVGSAGALLGVSVVSTFWLTG